VFVDVRTISVGPPANRSRNGSVAEIRLAGGSPTSGFLRKRLGKRRVGAGTLRVTEDALVVDARAELRGGLEIPQTSIRKAVVDDGARWGFVSEVCRFPVYADRPDGPGYGALIGPLWSNASSLMPPGCPVAALDPVPVQAPNLALIFEPGIPAPALRGQNGRRSIETESIVALLLCTDDPDAARAALGERLAIGDVDHDDLEYLIRNGEAHSGNEHAGNGASANGAPPASVSRDGAAA
jgi:hypothetical protein